MAIIEPERDLRDAMRNGIYSRTTCYISRPAM